MLIFFQRYLLNFRILDYNTGHFIDFSPEKSDFSSKCACISSTILTFLPNNPLCFYTKNSQKVHFPQIVPIIQGTLLTFLPKKVIISSKCAFISSIILTFLPNNPVCFYTKKYQKLNVPLNCDYNTGHLLTFLPKKVIFSSKCACISSTILTFLPNNPVCFYNKNSQKVNFPSNCDYNTGHFIDFSPKKSNFFLKMRQHIEHYFDFFAQ